MTAAPVVPIPFWDALSHYGFEKGLFPDCFLAFEEHFIPSHRVILSGFGFLRVRIAAGTTWQTRMRDGLPVYEVADKGDLFTSMVTVDTLKLLLRHAYLTLEPMRKVLCPCWTSKYNNHPTECENTERHQCIKSRLSIKERVAAAELAHFLECPSLEAHFTETDPLVPSTIEEALDLYWFYVITPGYQHAIYRVAAMVATYAPLLAHLLSSNMEDQRPGRETRGGVRASGSRDGSERVWGFACSRASNATSAATAAWTWKTARWGSSIW